LELGFQKEFPLQENTEWVEKYLQEGLEFFNVTTGTHWIEFWVNPKPCPATVEKEKLRIGAGNRTPISRFSSP
jgi:hypothetical protein